MKRTRWSMESLADLPEAIIWEPGMELQKDQPYVVGGLTLVIELLKGDTRSGVDAQGIPWESTVPAHYGYFLDTVGGDGEALDFYLKDNLCDWTAPVHVVDQLNLTSGSWDEHKVMAGFDSANEAEETYISAFSDEKGLDRLGATCTVSADAFLLWVYSGNTHTAMASQEVPGMVVRVTGRGTDALGETVQRPTLPVVVPRFGAVPVKLAPTQALTLVNLSAAETPRYAIYLLGPLFVTLKQRPILNDTVRLLKAATEQTQFDFYIASPGGDLIDAMRLASAMRVSKAKIVTHAVGPVCSAAVILWAEGHERQIGTCAYFMQHMSSHGDWGRSSHIAQRAAVIMQYLRNVILQRQIDVGLWTEQEVANLMDKATDLYITADEARERTGSR